MVRLVCQTGLLTAVGGVVARVASALFPVAFTVLTLAGAAFLFATAGLRWVWTKQVTTMTAAPVVTVAAVLAALVFVFGGGELNLISLVIAVVVASMIFQVTLAADCGLALLGWRASLMVATPSAPLSPQRSAAWTR